jgi:hypothetical protein
MRQGKRQEEREEIADREWLKQRQARIRRTCF